MVEPRQALPRRLPRICLRYLTFFGISMATTPLDLRQAQPVLRPRDALQLAFVDPALDADLPVGGPRFGEPIVDVGPQRVQRELPLQVPFRAGDLGSSQASGDPQLDPLRPE